MATISEGPKLAEAPKQPKKDKLPSHSYHTYKEKKDKKEKTEEERSKRPKYGRFGAMPPELSGVKLNSDAIPVLGEEVEQMYRQKLQERVAKAQQDPMLQIFNDCVEDVIKKTKPRHKKEKKSKNRDKDETKAKKKKKKSNKEEEEEGSRKVKKKKKSEKEVASSSSAAASSSHVHSSVVVASPSSSKWDKYNGTASNTSRPVQSVVRRPKQEHHRPISHGDWRDDRWQGRVSQQQHYGEDHGGRSGYSDEAWPPAAPSYPWDDGKSRSSDYYRSSDPHLDPSDSVETGPIRGSRRGARNYTGYNYRNDRSRSRSRSPVRAERRPSPPKDMPEHIRWLHERWRKYDKNFFSKQERPQEQAARSKGPTAEERRSYNAQMVEYTRERRGRGANAEPMNEGGRRFMEDKPAAAKKFGIPYYQFKSGGEFGWNPGRMYTFKEFLLSQPEDIEDQEKAVNMYNDYKLEFRKKALAEFFQAHSEDEWFLEKYHPMLRSRREALRREKVAKRLDAFMQLLVRGYMEVPIDFSCSRKIRRLMDSVIVLLEGGDEGDIACLSDLDYMLEEKREQAEEIKTEANADDSSDDEDNTEADPRKIPDTTGKAPGQGRTKEEQMADKEEGVALTEEMLEQMQHARDYSLYVREHEGGPDMSEAPDDLQPAGLNISTSYVGSGVFISQAQNPKPLEEMNLHKVSALLLRNIPPAVTRQELEEMCVQAHGGYLRLHPMDPDPNNKYFRDCVVSYWYNANLKKIMWKLKGTRLRGALLMVMDHREFVRRIGAVDGLAGDKSVVLRDIQLCKSLIEYLDKKERLWGHAGPEEEGEELGETSKDAEPPKTNPLLINLDECLAYHLHQLIEGGQEDPTAPKKAESGNKVDRDENLTRVLDRLILYLRIVHSVDYYGCKVYLTEDEQPRRIGLVSVRGEPSKTANPKRLANYIKQFEERLKSLFPHQARLASEHVELLGKRSTDSEVEKFIRTNVISVGDGMSKCCLCYKRFTTFEFASLHMREKHTDKLEEVKWVVFCFNAYLADPNRPCSVDFTSGEVVQST